MKYQLEILEKKGFIRRDPTRGRALEVLLPGDKTSTKLGPKLLKSVSIVLLINSSLLAATVMILFAVLNANI